MTDPGCLAGPSFSQEQQHRFQLRYEEGFDVSGDTDYICWLRLNHPDSPLLSRPTEAQTSTPSGESLVRQFSDLAVLAEIPVASTPSETTKMTPSASTICKFLIPPQASTPSGQKGEPPRASLLTSATAFEMLKEKERKKQEEAETKEKKRKEREEMKKKKEEEQTEERARK